MNVLTPLTLNLILGHIFKLKWNRILSQMFVLNPYHNYVYVSDKKYCLACIVS